jgi:hypothetical protein
MEKYYKQGGSIFKFDFDNQKVVCITDSTFNKGIVISDGMGGPFESMVNSFSSSLSNSVRVGEPTLESSEEEFQTAFVYAYESITSASLGL